MFQVVKRDGRDAEFQLTKIDDANRAVEKAKADILAAAVNLPAGKKQIVQVLCQTADIIVLWNRIGAWLNAGCPHGPCGATGVAEYRIEPARSPASHPPAAGPDRRCRTSRQRRAPWPWPPAC